MSSVFRALDGLLQVTTSSAGPLGLVASLHLTTTPTHRLTLQELDEVLAVLNKARAVLAESTDEDSDDSVRKHPAFASWVSHLKERHADGSACDLMEREGADPRRARVVREVAGISLQNGGG